MNNLTWVLACAGFLINSDNRAFVKGHIVLPARHAITRAAHSVEHPFHHQPRQPKTTTPEKP